jgi:hypothetical protein
MNPLRVEGGCMESVYIVEVSLTGEIRHETAEPEEPVLGDRDTVAAFLLEVDWVRGTSRLSWNAAEEAAQRLLRNCRIAAAATVMGISPGEIAEVEWLGPGLEATARLGEKDAVVLDSGPFYEAMIATLRQFDAPAPVS